MTFEEINDAWVRADGNTCLFFKYLNELSDKEEIAIPIRHGYTGDRKDLHDAQVLLENAGYSVFPPKEELTEKQVWYIDFIQRLLKAKNMDERSALLEELRNKKFND